MSDLIKDGVDCFRRYLKSHAGQTITYARGANSTNIVATPGRDEHGVIESNGVQVRFEERDFLIQASDIVLNGITVTPKDGDKITWNGDVYEVLSFDGGRPYTSSDNYETLFRVHTKQIEVA